MASLGREFSFCDRDQNNSIIRALYDLKQLSTFCDVIMKVCGREIFAHSSILAAASPYFHSFLSQDLPRQFSQRAPQIIEIQIDGSEPNNLYEEAVAAVIDFIYSGKMTIKDSNVTQICEIARIMQMDNIVKFCEDFAEGKSQENDNASERGSGPVLCGCPKHCHPSVTVKKVDSCVNTDSVDPSLFDTSACKVPGSNMYKLKSSTKVGDPAFQAKIKAKQLTSIANQVYPHMLPELARDHHNMIDQATSTDSRYFESLVTLSKIHSSPHKTYSNRGRKRKQLFDEHAFDAASVIPGRIEKELPRAELVVESDMNVTSRKETENIQLVDPEQETGSRSDISNMILSESSAPNIVMETNNSVISSSNIIDILPEHHGDINSETKVSEIGKADMHDPDVNAVLDNLGLMRGQDPTDAVHIPVYSSDDKVSKVVVLHPVTTSNEDNSGMNTDGIMVTSHSIRRSKRVPKPSARLQESLRYPDQSRSPVKHLPLQKIKEESCETAHTLVVQLADHTDEIVIDPSSGSITEASPAQTGVVEHEEMKSHEQRALEKTEQEEAAERLLSLADRIVQKEGIGTTTNIDDESRDVVQVSNVGAEEEYHDSDYDPRSEFEVDESREHSFLDTYSNSPHFERRAGKKSSLTSIIHIGPGKYQCESCVFTTNKVREMSAHIKLHKLENNTCYYCEEQFGNKEVLTQHMDKHKGPDPFFCHVCSLRFKSRTLLNMHLPKHSDKKPFICEMCCMGFKWKHALKCHMITHTNKKEHLCDICGYATAHKSQLKSHKKIHTGDTYKCNQPGCSYEATKIQNMKYHLLTHTREKPHQCELCGQNFSLVKNLRRHMLLHSTEKKENCKHCSFTSTRMDKIKEHLLKMHGVGTPPERRTRVSEMVLEHSLKAQQFHSIMPLAEPNVEVMQASDVTHGIVKSEDLVEEQEVATSEITTSTQQVIDLQDPATFQQIAQLHDLQPGSTEQTTLIEIIQDGVHQPMQIFPSQSILIAHPGGSQEGTIIQDGQYTEMVQIGSMSGQNLILTETMDTVTTSVSNAEGQTHHITGVPQSLEEVVALAQHTEGPMAHGSVTAVSQPMEIHNMVGEPVEYTEMVEVPVSHVSAGHIQLENKQSS